MKSFNISERLEQIAAYLPKKAIFADIGSDHAYLPCYVCMQDKMARAVVGEINQGPFLRAQNNIRSAGLTERIDVRLGNGLQVLIPGEVEQLVISGMGGTLILDILEAGIEKIQTIDRLIIQPNIDEPIVRKYLTDKEYTITNETLVEDNGHIYEILVAEKTKSFKPLTEKQLLFGPVLFQYRSPLFYKKWMRKYVKQQQIVQQIKNANPHSQSELNNSIKKLTWIKEAIQNEKAGTDC